MATLGYNTTPASGNWTDSLAASTQWWGTNGWTMPAGGGVVSDFYWYGAAQSGTTTITGCIWDSGGTLLWSAVSSAFGTSQTFQHISVPNVYVPAGTVYLGMWSAGTVNLQWQVTPGGTDGGVRRQSPASSAGNQGSNIDEYVGGGEGVFGCYITYTPGGGYVNTGTSGSPVWTATALYVNTGTSGSPVWTAANGVYVNTGTSGSPVWTPGG